MFFYVLYVICQPALVVITPDDSVFLDIFSPSHNPAPKGVRLSFAYSVLFEVLGNTSTYTKFGNLKSSHRRIKHDI